MGEGAGLHGLILEVMARNSEAMAGVGQLLACQCLALPPLVTKEMEDADGHEELPNLEEAVEMEGADFPSSFKTRTQQRCTSRTQASCSLLKTASSVTWY